MRKRRTDGWSPARSRTIQDVDGDDWGEPPPEAGHLVRRCTQLRRKPLTDFTVEDLRIMLGQEMNVRILLPLAVDVLALDPLAEGDLYPGDLLWSVLRLPRSAWDGRPDLRDRLGVVLEAVDWEDTDVPKEMWDVLVAGGWCRPTGDR